MSSITYKNVLFYIVKTEEDFIRDKTTQLYKEYKDVRMLLVKYLSEKDNVIRFAANDEIIYETKLQDFLKRNTILTQFTINMN